MDCRSGQTPAAPRFGRHAAPPPFHRPTRAWRRVRRRVLLHRRLLAALAAGAAVLVGLQAAAPPPPPTVAVWTAARDLPSGTVLSAGDLVSAAYPPDAVPARRRPRPAGGGRRHPGRAPCTRASRSPAVRTLGAGAAPGLPGHHGRAAAHHRRRRGRAAPGRRPGQLRRGRPRRARGRRRTWSTTCRWWRSPGRAARASPTGRPGGSSWSPCRPSGPPRWPRARPRAFSSRCGAASVPA